MRSSIVADPCGSATRAYRRDSGTLRSFLSPISRECINVTIFPDSIRNFVKRNDTRYADSLPCKNQKAPFSRAHRLPLSLLKTESACGLLWNAILSLWLSPQDFRPGNAACPGETGTAGVVLMEPHARVYAKACEVRNPVPPTML